MPGRFRIQVPASKDPGHPSRRPHEGVPPEWMDASTDQGAPPVVGESAQEKRARENHKGGSSVVYRKVRLTGDHGQDLLHRRRPLDVLLSQVDEVTVFEVQSGYFIHYEREAVILPQVTLIEVSGDDQFTPLTHPGEEHRHLGHR